MEHCSGTLTGAVIRLRRREHLRDRLAALEQASASSLSQRPLFDLPPAPPDPEAPDVPPTPVAPPDPETSPPAPVVVVDVFVGGAGAP
jgi:hypothetical protein